MDGQTFLAEFGYIADAPGGVARLRDLILALAVQGRLVPQVESDEPAAKQLARIGLAVSNRPISGRRKKAVPAAQADDASVAAVPNGWVRTRLCDLVRVLNGRAYSKQELLESGTPVLRVGNLFTSNHWYYSDLALEADKYCDTGDLLFAWSASFGPFIWNGGRVIFHYHIWKLDLFSYEELNKSFLHTWLLEKTQEIKASGHGISMAHMTKERFELLEIALPPLEEQGRIVLKVDELMELCDQLEREQQGRRKLQKAFRQSTLQALISAQSSHELQLSWRRLQSNFGYLMTEPSDVGSLRTLILELAVRGLLTRRCVSDTPAKDQLVEIHRRSVETTRQDSGRRRRVAAYRPIDEDELAYQAPNGWALARLGELVRVLNGRAYAKSELLDRGTPVLRVGNLFTSKDWYYSNLELEPDKYCQKGDLIYAWSASFGPFIWEGPKVIYHYHIWKLSLFSEEFLSKEFLYLALQERTAAIKSSGHGISMAHMTKEKMEQLPIAIPPLEEQHRIVLVVADLMALCDEIERQLNASTRLARRLAAETVSALTGIANEHIEDTEMKAPKTELIAPLRIGMLPDVNAQAPLATILVRHQGEMAARDLWQRFGGGIDDFYAQLKTEVAHGWIAEPDVAQMREKPTAEAVKG
jgi:type I restriction enzyme S subunit